MNNNEFITYHGDCCDKMHATVIAKNTDYSSDETDAFSNFKTTEMLGISTAESNIMNQILNKLNRTNAFVKRGVLLVADEKIEDTLLDLANYAILLAGYIKAKKDDDLAKGWEELEGSSITEPYIPPTPSVDPPNDLPF